MTGVIKITYLALYSVTSIDVFKEKSFPGKYRRGTELLETWAR